MAGARHTFHAPCKRRGRRRLPHSLNREPTSTSTWKGTLVYQRPTPTRLSLEGDVDGKHIQMLMTLHDLNKFLLVSRGFNWVQEQAFNR